MGLEDEDLFENNILEEFLKQGKIPPFETEEEEENFHDALSLNMKGKQDNRNDNERSDGAFQ